MLTRDAAGRTWMGLLGLLLAASLPACALLVSPDETRLQRTRTDAGDRDPTGDVVAPPDVVTDAPPGDDAPPPPDVTGECDCRDGQRCCDGRCVDTGTDVAHCGGCGIRCPMPPSGTPICREGRCELECPPDRGDCDRQYVTGCEASLDTVSACGACGASCAAVNGAPRCEAGQCAISCAPGFGDCDANAANGCEAETDTVEHCGACNRRCTQPGSICARVPSGVQSCCYPVSSGGACMSTCTGTCGRASDGRVYCCEM